MGWAWTIPIDPLLESYKTKQPRPARCTIHLQIQFSLFYSLSPIPVANPICPFQLACSHRWHRPPAATRHIDLVHRGPH